ncbi:MAG: Rieske 2Fe-2S domain-containing protein [Paludibacterium sp.]|uniref:Rieske (2Fe-2S) protein n=1 Tax=Paludibacterium sp. TaxID=1917523 RepID=UPI0025D342AF|nr:Rieske 2Fe-2S domain-containing protein [Paludibacterium sp.]MBV8049206.1 Rieske 2Fe-2S domain-containing protein [Paludibacterium sp.]MBV8647253.1 Rieske 2Fe-2S domain-containing protein [Paludibacterium sp.]
MVEDTDHLICPSAELVERGPARRFDIPAEPCAWPAFVVRYQGKVYGYLNACRHVPVQLDWREGEIFDLSGHYLICSMHGARYLPDSGVCVAGPCKGQRLIPVITKELNGMIYYVKPIAAPERPAPGVTE